MIFWTKELLSYSKVLYLFSLSDQDGNYDCSSSSTLTFCFARSTRSTQRQTTNQSKVQRHRDSAAVNAAADSEL